MKPTIVRLKKLLNSNLGTLIIFLAFATGVSYWQQKDMTQGMIPAHQYTLLDHSKADLKQLATQGPLLIYFWGSWCGICNLTSPAVNDIAADAEESGFRVITVALSSGNNQELRQYLNDEGYQFAVINDDNGSISEQWGVNVTPSFFYVDNKGDIVWISTGLSSEWGMRLKLWWLNQAG